MTTTLTKRYMQKTILTIALTASCLGAMAQTEPIRIDLSQKGAVVSPNLYGIFFEEISHAGDGGLYVAYGEVDHPVEVVLTFYVSGDGHTLSHLQRGG